MLFSDQAKQTGQTVKDSGVYMVGQTAGFSLPQEDKNIGYWTWGVPGGESPNYAYLYIQIPTNMTRVNYCKVFWRILRGEYYFNNGMAVCMLNAMYQETVVSAEISIDEGVNWTALPGSPYTGDQTDIDIIDYIRKINAVSGKRLILRWACTTADTACRLIASGWLQGNLLSV
ncbi:MAG: hypothetical protein Q8R70_09315 [Methanoregula sp.]|nr:hypothetical protein [Methanoregula sp.]